MKNLFFTGAIILIAFQTIAQKTPADSLREIGKLKEAVDQYAILVAEKPDDKATMYNYACALALLNQRDSAFYYLNRSLIGDTTARPLNDPDFYFLLRDPRWDTLENDMLQRIEVSMFHYKNPELVKELWRMKIKDQAFYYQEDLLEDPLANSAIWELKRLLNEQNLARLQEIIAEYGWPQKSDIGGMAASTVFLVIQHADLETQKKYLPLMMEAANKKEADWSSLALLIDRINIREGKPQVYGSQIRRKEDGSFEVFEIEDPEYVNQRRAEVGLGPLEEYVGMWKIDWTVPQKTKK